MTQPTSRAAEQAELAAERRTAAFATLGLAIVLITGSLFLVNQLQTLQTPRDCQSPAQGGAASICGPSAAELTASR
jgi:hypothetical protein